MKYAKLLKASSILAFGINIFAAQAIAEVLVSDSNGIAGYMSINGAGQIQPAQRTTSANAAQSGSNGIGIGDFDNDGLVDYVRGGVDSSTQQAKLFFHKRTAPSNNFAAGVPIMSETQTTPYIMDFGVADFNKDGNLDFAVNDYGANGVRVYLGSGDGTFQHLARFDVGFSAIGLDTEDLNGDGHPDIAVSQFSSGPGLSPVAIMLGDGLGGFTVSTQNLETGHSLANYSRGISLGDFDSDGIADAVITGQIHQTYGDKMVRFHRGNGDGTFQSSPTLTAQWPFALNHQSNLLSVDDADFNNDGKLDLIMASTTSHHVFVYLGDGNGTFTISSQGAVLVSTQELPAALTGIATLPFEKRAIVQESAPVANVGGPYFAVTDDVLVNRGSTKSLNRNSNKKWVKTRLRINPNGKASVELNAGLSSDADGDQLTYSWVITKANGTSFTAAGVKPVLELPVGQYNVALTVQDGTGRSSTSSTTLSVSLLDLEQIEAADVFLNGVQADRIRYRANDSDADDDNLDDDCEDDDNDARPPVLVVRFSHSAVMQTIAPNVKEATLVLSGAVSAQVKFKIKR